MFQRNTRPTQDADGNINNERLIISRHCEDDVLVRFVLNTSLNEQDRVTAARFIKGYEPFCRIYGERGLQNENAHKRIVVPALKKNGNLALLSKVAQDTTASESIRKAAARALWTKLKRRYPICNTANKELKKITVELFGCDWSPGEIPKDWPKTMCTWLVSGSPLPEQRIPEIFRLESTPKGKLAIQSKVSDDARLVELLRDLGDEEASIAIAERIKSQDSLKEALEFIDTGPAAKALVEKVTDANVLNRLIICSEEPKLVLQAIKKAQQSEFIVKAATGKLLICSTEYDDTAKAALRYITPSQHILLDVSLKAKSQDVQERAALCLTDQSVITKYIVETGKGSLLLEKLTEKKWLAEVAQNCKSSTLACKAVKMMGKECHENLCRIAFSRNCTQELRTYIAHTLTSKKREVESWIEKHQVRDELVRKWESAKEEIRHSPDPANNEPHLGGQPHIIDPQEAAEAEYRRFIKGIWLQ